MKMKRMLNLLLCGGLGVLSVVGAAHAESARPAKPNVVLILTDDFGWQDVGCYDIDKPSPMETPNIDALAKRGVLFRQAYSPAPTCAPSRAAILSGHHPARAQMTHVSGGAPPAPHHATRWSMMSPWYSARMPAATVTIAEALKAHGYVTGHSGKWHVVMKHHGDPQPEAQGFDYTRSNRGATTAPRPNRQSRFASAAPNDPYRLDENGFPFHQNSEDALAFISQSKAKPFLLYYATWLVHTPIHTRSKALLDKYVKKLGVSLPDDPAAAWTGKGQTNPYYCAMVEMVDYYAGKVFNMLETTEDPRWPGHMLIENTYVIFTSDNGGMENGSGGEIITDNFPLDKGKISVMEGGTRVPLIITGPGIKAGVDSDVMVNGLDFYPTILALTGTTKPVGKQLDGLNLAPLLLRNPADASLVKDSRGKVRDTMVWHFPNSAALESSIRIGDYKLVRNYNHHIDARTRPLELYRLYDSKDGAQKRADIEEAKDLVEAMPEKARAMDQRLTTILTEMKASYPYLNPDCKRLPDTRKRVASVLSHKQTGDRVVFGYKDNGAKVIRANLIYTENAGHRFEEWFRAPAMVGPDMTVTAKLPKGATHYFINLIDENNYLRSYPAVVDATSPSKSNVKFAERALKVGG
ncbi:MAG: arylsulfatase A-like enzyme [Candidatus Promineifilaceae bacterium]|jgi:arylsulfatase A-like enzyme